MSAAFDITVVIPTCPHRIGKLQSLLSGLASTREDLDRFEVVIVVDDLDAAPLDAAERELDGIAYRGFTQRQQGPARARNRAIEESRGRWLLFFDDDALVDCDTVAGHLRCIDANNQSPLAYLGRVDWPDCRLNSPWSLLLARSSMLFFWDKMSEDQTYGFRHFWTSNLSVRTEWVRQVGGFNESFPIALHEDIELGWRLQQRFALRVQPVLNIRSWHDHPLTPRDYFRREYDCGVTAAGSRSINPAFHDAIWSWADEAAGMARTLQRLFAKSFGDLLELIARWAVPSSYEPTADAIQSAYLAHLPLKRLCFCRGYGGLGFDRWWDELSAAESSKSVAAIAG